MHRHLVVAVVKFIARKVRKLSRTAPHIFLIATTSFTIHANALADSLDGLCFPVGPTTRAASAPKRLRSLPPLPKPYGYDAAYRITTIQDGLGNSVRYTLDAMGNRTGETVNDPSGAVVRRVVRAYDPLNRLLQITGADK